MHQMGSCTMACLLGSLEIACVVEAFALRQLVAMAQGKEHFKAFACISLLGLCSQGLSFHQRDLLGDRRAAICNDFWDFSRVPIRNSYIFYVASMCSSVFPVAFMCSSGIGQETRKRTTGSKN